MLQGSMQSRDTVWPLVSFQHWDQHCKRVRRSFSEFFWSFRSNRVSRFLFGQILRKCFELISRRCLATRLLATAGSTPWISFEINLAKKDFSWGRHCEYLFSWKDWAQRKQWSWGLQWIWCTIQTDCCNLRLGHSLLVHHSIHPPTHPPRFLVQFLHRYSLCCHESKKANLIWLTV